MSKPKEFWVLDEPGRPYPTCYRGEPTWGGEPDPANVVHVREISSLERAAPDLLQALKDIAHGLFLPSNDDPREVEKAIRQRCLAAITKAEGA